jgi:hypothetical protein
VKNIISQTAVRKLSPFTPQCQLRTKCLVECNLSTIVETVNKTTITTTKSMEELKEIIDAYKVALKSKDIRSIQHAEVFNLVLF